MPRSNLRRSSVFPYHVTGRVNNRDEFPIPLREAWKIFSLELLYLRITCGVEIQAFVLMLNHFHLILTTPVLDLGRAMNIFMSNTTRRINLKSGRSGRLYDKSYFRTLIDQPTYYGHAFKYVYRNPVKAKLVERVEDYSFSTLYGLLGRDQLPFPLHFTRTGWDDSPLFRESDAMLEWLNRPSRQEHIDTIRSALRRKRFKLPTVGSNRKPHPLESELL